MMNIWIKMFIIEFRGNAQIYHVSSRSFLFYSYSITMTKSFLHEQQPFKQLIIFMSSSTAVTVSRGVHVYIRVRECVCITIIIILLCRWRRVHYEKHLSVDIRQSDQAVKCCFFYIYLLIYSIVNIIIFRGSKPQRA